MNRFKKHLIAVPLVLVVISTVAAQTLRYPKYTYYGEILSVDEFLKLVENGPSLNCTPPSNIEYGVNEASIDYICFNTQKEVDAYIDEVLDAKPEQSAQENPASRPVGSNKLLMSLSNHWALYANSPFIAPHLGDVHNGTSCQSTSSGVWSAWKDGSPNNLTLYRYTNCTGNPAFTYSSSLYACVFAWPIGCGGSQGASVP